MPAEFSDSLQALHILFRPQSSLLCDTAGKILPDFITHYEDFQNQLNIACTKIGLPEQALDHVNASIHNDWSSYFNDELKELVQQHYAVDFVCYGYDVKIKGLFLVI